MDIQKKASAPRRAAAYCRVSKLLEEQDMSFETQVSYYENLISKDKSMILVGVYGDHGFSGLSAVKRPEFQRMIQDCEHGLIDVILCKSISRFSRNSVECAEYLERLKQCGVEVLFEKEGLSSTDPRTQMVLAIYSSMAQNESCSISENIRWTQTRLTEAGDPPRRIAYGYRRITVGGKHKWIIHEEEAAAVRKVFSLAHACYTIREISEFMTDWSVHKIGYVLRNEAYRGDILTGKLIKLDYLSKKYIRNNGHRDQYYLEQHHEPIVPPAVFDDVQQYLKDNLLDGKWSKKRQAWFEQHPEILKRREALKNAE